jgi:hypothetical protein
MGRYPHEESFPGFVHGTPRDAAEVLSWGESFGGLDKGVSVQ